MKTEKFYDVGQIVCNRCQKMTAKNTSDIETLKTNQIGFFVKRPSKDIKIGYQRLCKNCLVTQNHGDYKKDLRIQY